MVFRNYAIAAMASTMMIAGAAHAMPTMDYLKMAGAGDMYEKQSSQIVLQSTKDAKVRDFANMMITDHTKSTADVKAAAKQDGVSPKPPMLMPKQATMISQLKKAKGPARDALYVEQQKTAHQEALATHQDYASTGDKPALKSVASTIVPVVQQHITMLSSM